jgi:hypothetical protein
VSRDYEVQATREAGVTVDPDDLSDDMTPGVEGTHSGAGNVPTEDAHDNVDDADVTDVDSAVDTDADGPETEDGAEETAPPRAEHSTPDRTRARELFERLTALPPDSPERAQIRSTLVAG